MPDDPTPNREQLIKRLSSVQNTGAFSHVDILSITGAMTDAQLAKYVADKEKEAANFSPKRRPFTTGKQNSN
jgi:hypothetical protein